MSKHAVLIIDNVRSALNVGSFFRTSDGAGVSRIILCGYTPTPIDRFGRIQKQIEKTSLGAVSSVAWEQKETLEEILACVADLKKEGYVIVSLEQTDRSIPIQEFEVPDKVAYIVGNEVEGVREELLEASDLVVEIPMHGKKESLNVGVATGILLFHA